MSAPKPNPFSWSGPPQDPALSSLLNQFIRWVQGALNYLLDRSDNSLLQPIVQKFSRAAITGNGAEQILFADVVPGGRIAAGQGLRVRLVWQHGTGAAAVAYKIYFGGQLYTSFSDASAAVNEYEIEVYNDAGTTAKQNGNVAHAIINGAASVGVVSGLAQELSRDLQVRMTFNVTNTDKVTPLLMAMAGIP